MNFCIPVMENQFLGSEISGHFGKAPGFLLVNGVSGDVVAFLDRKRRDWAGCAPLEAMVENRVDGVVCHGLGAGALRNLRQAGIRVYRTEATTVAGALEEFAGNRLRELGYDQVCSTGHACEHPS